MRRRVAIFAAPVVALLSGAVGAARADAPTPLASAPATRPAITVVRGAEPPPAAVAAAASATPAPRDGPPPPPPLPGRPRFDPPGPTGCDAQTVPHPDGFAAMAGAGSDVLTPPGKPATRYPVWTSNLPLQAVCVAQAADGSLEVQLYVQPVGPDTDVFDLHLGPSGAVLHSLTPGRSGDGFTPVVLDLSLGPWPAAGCHAVKVGDGGGEHAHIADTLCLAADGWPTHLDLDEQATSPQGFARDLVAHLDLQRP